MGTEFHIEKAPTLVLRRIRVGRAVMLLGMPYRKEFTKSISFVSIEASTKNIP